MLKSVNKKNVTYEKYNNKVLTKMLRIKKYK